MACCRSSGYTPTPYSCGFAPGLVLVYVVLRLIMLTCQASIRNLVHMTAALPPASHAKRPQAATVLSGIPVVAGAAYAPVIRPGRLPVMDGVDSLPGLRDGRSPPRARTARHRRGIGSAGRDRRAGPGPRLARGGGKADHGGKPRD